jgi:hypothetical protein
MDITDIRRLGILIPLFFDDPKKISSYKSASVIQVKEKKMICN